MQRTDCGSRLPPAAGLRSARELNPVQRRSAQLPNSSTPMLAGSIPEAPAVDLRPIRENPTMNMNDKIDDAELVRLGIERVQTESFRWGGYRYTNASDAIAAAKRVKS